MRGPDQRPALHKGPRIPTGHLLTVVAGLGLGLGALHVVYDKFHTEPQATPPAPIAGPAIPGESKNIHEELTISPELYLFMQVYAKWRESLPQKTSVSVTFYPEGISATVAAKEGVMRRTLPTSNSSHLAVIPHNGRIGESEYDLSRFKVTVTSLEGNSEEWLGHRELAPVYKSDNPVRYEDMFFSIKKIGDEETIHIDKESQNATTIEWPRPTTYFELRFP